MLKTSGKTVELMNEPNDISMSYARMLTDIMHGNMEDACDVPQAIETIKIIERLKNHIQ